MTVLNCYAPASLSITLYRSLLYSAAVCLLALPLPYSSRLALTLLPARPVVKLSIRSSRLPIYRGQLGDRLQLLKSSLYETVE